MFLGRLLCNVDSSSTLLRSCTRCLYHWLLCKVDSEESKNTSAMCRCTCLPTPCNLKKNPFMSCLTLSLLILHVLLLWQINFQRNAKKSFFQNIVCIFSIKHYHKDNEADQSIINMKRKQSCSSASCRTSAWNIVLDFFFKYFCGNNPCQRFFVLKYFCGTNLKGTTKPGWEGKECPSL